MKVTLHFHGSRSETYAMARGWADESGMVLVAECFFPVYQVRLAGGEEGVEELDECGNNVDRISINPSPVDLGATSSLDYAKRNPDSLFIVMGEQSEDLLRESFLSAMTDDPVLAGRWKVLRERARKSMFKGAWVENVVSGARSRAEGHYCTPEAKRLADSGVQLVGGTDWIRYRFQ